MNDVDPLTERALRARASLQAATNERPVPAFNTEPRRASRAIPRWAAPMMAAVAVASLVLGIVWSSSDNPRSVVTVGAVTTVQIGQMPGSVVSDGHLVWVADTGTDQVVAVDAHTLRQQWSIRTDGRPVALAYGLSALWVVEADSTRLLKLDPLTGKNLRVARTSLDPVAVDVAFGSVWVLSAGNHTLDRYDATSLAPTGSALLQAAGRALAHTNDALWVAAPGALLRVAPAGPSSLPVRTVAVSGDPQDVVATSASVWASLGDGALVTFDGATGTELARVALSAPVNALATRGDGVVVSTADGLLQQVNGPGGRASHVASTGTPVDALAVHGQLIFGTARSAALLYATEVAR